MIFRLAFLIGISLIVNGQILRVPVDALGERIVVVVPMVGKGTPDDPVRPKYAPLGMSAAYADLLRKQGKLPPGKVLSDKERMEEQKREIGAYSYVLADDGKRAIVEFVARDREAFAEILKDLTVRWVDKAKLNDAIEIDELRKVKKGFELKELRTAGY